MAEGITDEELARAWAAAQAATQAPAPAPEQTAQAGGGFSDAEMAAAFAKSAPPAAPAGPRAPQGYVAGLARNIGHGALAGWSDEALAKAREILGGENYAAALADERARVEEFRKANPKTAMAAELGGAFLTPGVGIAAGALKAPATTLGRMAQAAKVGAAYGAASGAGTAEEGERLAGAAKGGLVGAAIAPVFPLVGKALSAPSGKIGELVSGSKISRAPTEEAADFALMRGMQKQNLTPSGVRASLNEADRVGVMHPAGVKDGKPIYSQTESPVALADYVPKIAGQTVRASPEAQTRAETFFRARQTGQVPATKEGEALIANAGLNTRNMMGRADMAHGEPAGQWERIKDLLKRGFLLIDTKYHGHQPNTYLTFKAIEKEGRDNAVKLYGAARAAAKGYDLSKDIDPVLTEIKNRIKSPQTDAATADLLRKVVRAFTVEGKGKQAISSLEGFDSAKRAVDQIVTRAKMKGKANTVRVLLGDDKAEPALKALIAKVDAITHEGIGTKYAAARGQFSSDHELLDAIEFGRNIRTANLHEATAKFGELGDTHQKLARLGLIENVEAAGLDRARADDLTRMFETPRMQELLRKMTPMSKDAGAVFGDRPERVYDFMRNERMMADTPRRVLGGSQTAERMADDAAFTRETLTSMVERMRGIPSATNIGIEVAAMAINKVFGYREDVARALGQRLFTANREQQHAILTRLEKIWGTDTVSRLVRAIDGAAQAAGLGTASTTAKQPPPKPVLAHQHR